MRIPRASLLVACCVLTLAPASADEGERYSTAGVLQTATFAVLQLGEGETFNGYAYVAAQEALGGTRTMTLIHCHSRCDLRHPSIVSLDHAKAPTLVAHDTVLGVIVLTWEPYGPRKTTPYKATTTSRLCGDDDAYSWAVDMHIQLNGPALLGDAGASSAVASGTIADTIATSVLPEAGMVATLVTGTYELGWREIPCA